MNDTIKTIMNRRSSRKYNARQVSEKDLDMILKSGLYAPSAKGIPTTKFFAINTPSKMEELRKIIIDIEGKDSFYAAKTIILVSGLSNDLHSIRNASAAIENMLLSAESLGINACWIHRVTLINEKNRPYLDKIGLLPNEELMGSVILGYGEKSPLKERDDSLIIYL